MEKKENNFNFNNKNTNLIKNRETNVLSKAKKNETVYEVNTNQKTIYNFNEQYSVSDTIDTSETLKDFEEQERQIAKELESFQLTTDIETLKKKQEKINQNELFVSKKEVLNKIDFVMPCLKEIFKYVDQYISNPIKIEPVLKPFLLDYIPTVGDVDPFIKIPKPTKSEDNLGLLLVDEPSNQQSNSALIGLQLHQKKQNLFSFNTPVKSISKPNKNKHQIEIWIESINKLQKSKPLDRITYVGGFMPDLERLMQEWPLEIEKKLKNLVLPTSKLTASLEEYTDMCLSLIDIPVYDDRRIQSLNLLFLLYFEFKNSQHFKNVDIVNNYKTFQKKEEKKENNRLEL